jgi:hypothetical protein
MASVGTPVSRVAWARASGPCVAWQQSLRYLQLKRGRMEQWREPQDWTRRESPSRREVGRRRQRGRMTHQR